MGDFDFAAIGEMGHILGEFGEASNSKFRKATKGNDVVLIHDPKDMPSPDKMEPNVLYLHKNDKGELLASAVKKTMFSSKPTTMSLEEALLKDAKASKDPEAIKKSEDLVKRIKQSVNNSTKPALPSEEDLKKVFSATKEVISKTNREAALEAGGNIGAAAVALANCAIVPCFGSKNAIKAFEDTAVGKGVAKATKAVAESNNPIVKGARAVAKGWDVTVGRVGQEVGAVGVSVANGAIATISGSKNVIPVLRDSSVGKATKWAAEKAGALWGRAKANSDVAKAADKVATKFHTIVNSKAMGHAMSIGFGVSAALAMGAGVAFSAPVSVPLIAVSAAAVIGAGANAEKRRKDLGAEKAHLEDIVGGIGKKNAAIEEMKSHNQEIVNALGLSEERLREIPKPGISTFRASHSYAEKEVIKTLASNAALIAVKSVEAASNPLSVGLQGAALAVGAASSVNTKLNESQAKHTLQKEIDLLKKVVPAETEKLTSVERAIEGKKKAIEGEALEKASQALEKARKDPEKAKEDLEKARKDPLHKDPVVEFVEASRVLLEATKELKAKRGSPDEVKAKIKVDKATIEVKKQFAEIKKEVTKSFEAEKENQQNYSKARTEAPEKGMMGMMKSFGRSVKQYTTHTTNYLFNEKASYKESVGVKPATTEVVMQQTEAGREKAAIMEKRQSVMTQVVEKVSEKSIKLAKEMETTMKATAAVAKGPNLNIRSASMQQQKGAREAG